MSKQKETGLVLTGGGARGAYQAGALRGIAEIAAKYGKTVPFGIISGASAGAINASFVAAAADDFTSAMTQLANFWGSLHANSVFRTDVRALGRTGMHWAGDLTLGGLKRSKRASALFDTAPLERLILDSIPFRRIRANLDRGIIQACEVSALDYRTSENVSFIMSRMPMVAWVHPRRRSVFTDIASQHVLASSAIPLIFPPVSVEGRYYGDGCVRNPAPFSPAIRLGARRLLIVGVRHGRDRTASPPEALPPTLRPSIGKILGVMINAVMMDTVEYDIDRLARLNSVIRGVPEVYRNQMPIKEIEFLSIQPSEDLGEMAAQQFHRLPGPIQHIVRGLGSRTEASELASYLLFEPAFCRLIAELGRQDVHRMREQITAFLFE